MKREIEFRALTESGNKFVFWFYQEILSEYVKSNKLIPKHYIYEKQVDLQEKWYYWPLKHSASWRINIDTLWQYTWLEDKNWEKIYEWDIVLLSQKAYDTIETRVIFKNWWFELRAIRNNRIWMFWDILTTSEIIMRIKWNIYQNPNLKQKYMKILKKD